MCAFSVKFFDSQSQTFSSKNPVDLPVLKPLILPTQGKGFLGKILSAAKPRDYELQQDWRIQISGASYVTTEGMDNFEGVLVIPEGAVINGASVPCPWLMAVFSFGVMRPVGVLFTASVVHDYAFTNGEWEYQQANGSQASRPIERQVADAVFRDMIQAVNGMPITAQLAWLAVRLGWPIVRYHGNLGTGICPFLQGRFWLTLLLAIGLLSIPVVVAKGLFTCLCSLI